MQPEVRAPGFAGLAIGLTLTLIHLISIPVSNTSVNPARSTGVAFVNANGAPAQLWVFWLAPLIGAAIGGIAYPYLFGRYEELADRPVRDDALEANDDSGQRQRVGPDPGSDLVEVGRKQGLLPPGSGSCSAACAPIPLVGGHGVRCWWLLLRLSARAGQ